jgi:hypothetical protein
LDFSWVMLLTAGLSTVPHAQLITEIYYHAPMLPCCALLSDRVSVHFVYLALLHGKI